jgi:hypothetical protein
MLRKIFLIPALVSLSVIGWRAVGQTPGLPTLEPQEGIFITPIAGQLLSATVTIEVKRELKTAVSGNVPLPPRLPAILKAAFTMRRMSSWRLDRTGRRRSFPYTSTIRKHGSTRF